jgi:hypothetical protein
MMAGLDGFAATRKPRFLALTALATCGTWLGSSPQMAYFGTGLAFLYALFLRRPALVAAVGLGVALAAPLLLPVAEMTALGPRGAGVTYKFAASWSWPDRSVWAAMLLPRAWGGRPDFHGPMNYWELQGYFGLLPMALMLCAPVRKKGLWLFAAVAALGLWISFGDSSWLGLHGWAVKLLPGYGSFRNPTRALMPSMFCVAVLAAEGLAALRDDYRLRVRVMSACGALLIFVALLAIFPRGFSIGALRTGAAWAALLLVLAAGWAFFARADPRWAALAVPLLLTDLAVQTWDSPEIGESAREGHALQGLERRVSQAPAPRRVAALLDWGEMNNATFARGWEGVTGYGPTPIQRVLLLLYGTWTGMIPRPQPLDDDPNFPRFRVDSELTRLFAAPLLAANREASVPPLARDGDVRLYPIPSLPRVYWTGTWRAASDTELGLPLLQKASRGLLAILPEKADLPSGPEVDALPAESVQVHASWTSATIRAPRDGLVVVLDPWFPGWSATVDGAPATLLRANYAFMAVPVRAGQHTLRLAYFPTRLLPGLAIAFLAAAALVALLKLTSRRVDTGSPGGY